MNPNHPTPEQWAAFLYNEDGEAQHRTLDAHRHTCPECAAHLEQMRNAMRALDGWKLTKPSRTQAARTPVLRWTAAAAVLLAAGIAIGRFGIASPSSVRNSMQLEMDARLAAARSENQQFFTGLIRELDQKHETETANLLVTLKQMDARRAAEASRLRRDLDTVAVVSDARLSLAQEQLNELTNPTQPLSSTPPDDR